MGLYFKLKLYSEYIIPMALIVLLIVANFIYIAINKINEWIKRRKGGDE